LILSGSAQKGRQELTAVLFNLVKIEPTD
jgi:hypothetical protein